jgi:transcriptional regulator with PAS, ATPase and Fis domain
MLVYSKKISNYISKVSVSTGKIKGNDFKLEDVSRGIPMYNETELFDLADKVTKLATTVHNDTSNYKDRILHLENDNAKHRVISTYTTSILNSINLPIMVTDSLLKVSFVNSEFEKLWKIKSSNVVDVDIVDLPFVRVVDGWQESLSKITRDEKKKDFITFKGEFRVSTKTKRRLEFQIMPLKDQKAREILGSLTIVKDLTVK